MPATVSWLQIRDGDPCGLLNDVSALCHIRTALSAIDPSIVAAGPREWNELPFSLHDTGLSLTTFNAHLKTYLFSTAFEATAHL